jgi:hypothetical protein
MYWQALDGHRTNLQQQVKEDGQSSGVRVVAQGAVKQRG